MEKLDFKKTLKHLYSGKIGEESVVTVPPMQFISIIGKGNPNSSQEYIDAIQALYPVAYTLKFMSKKNGADYAVPPLEGLWWSDNMQDFANGNKDDWQWKMMIMQPDFITEKMFIEACQSVELKKAPVSLGKVKFEIYDEGRSAQVMYVGAYSNEGPTISKLHSFIETQGGSVRNTNKPHHEIYIGDPRKTTSDKLKTIIRQPF